MKLTVVSVIVAVALIGVVLLIPRGGSNVTKVENVNNVTITDGKQIIEISAKGGYQPQKSIARAGIPTVIRFNTSGTFDCSSAVRIPSMGISKNLPASGVTDIDIGSTKVGVLQVLCAMGMYHFEIDFQN